MIYNGDVRLITKALYIMVFDLNQRNTTFNGKSVFTNTLSLKSPREEAHPYLGVSMSRSPSSTGKCQNCKAEHCDPGSNP
ncbi:hypothetical protein MTR_2g070450 [Medicago truncatula]|uniref:Uncharacterized protein n=1 Tax=Medicago truncatula TaxID=3880 RepID=A0A072VAK3_MEDTR|nr:hypothetical protein MTR_2g070450 [Medicago truncatula]